jgi:hypothetical protein
MVLLYQIGKDADKFFLKAGCTGDTHGMSNNTLEKNVCCAKVEAAAACRTEPRPVPPLESC